MTKREMWMSSNKKVTENKTKNERTRWEKKYTRHVTYKFVMTCEGKLVSK